MISRFLTTVFLTFHVLQAAPLRTDTFVEALAEAKKTNQPIAVYVHGSSWHPASRQIKEKIWDNTAFASEFKHPVILTDIDVKQSLNEEERKLEEAKYAGWTAAKTYPAIQIYGADGYFLKSHSGEELRSVTSAVALADLLNHSLAAAEKRQQLLVDLDKARKANDEKIELDILTQLIELPLNKEDKIVDQLKKIDPDDTSGWQARLSFENWNFLRRISNLIKDNKIDEALSDTDQLLATSHHTPEQRALILGAKGRALAAQNKLVEAWAVFQEAHQADPHGANGKAIYKYGSRVAGIPLREAFPTNSALRGKAIGNNLTRDFATFTMSSTRYDKPDDHPTLFKGHHAKSGHAFHTDEEKGAHIIIDLQAPCQIKAMRILNRKNNSERAENLTVWASPDQKNWQKIWAAEKLAPAWDIFLEQAITARYLKVGLQPDAANHLHLQAVDVYGVRP